ncbi:MAG: cyclic nucleotide-binding protein [Novosphingobium pentaromativorans]|uniref:Cyclic nucleotide-binding protein n=1 Tax=Novosphingobium pentaromativorans TaxID=205844 RepID=A0A2W5NVC0_9SPHN|nr:TonB-dependent receptor [Novosphingobium panipatense]PZQ57416.1 MAG: cyclic nucleotide-binding protein [Novosphingobium pentaromativorans]
MIKSRFRVQASACAMAMFACASGIAHADEASPNPAAGSGDDIIVTARAGSAQKKVEASYAISTISEAELQMKAPIGVGEALKNVPGFWVESSSGEASGNIRVRGIPTDGFSALSLLEDGITIQHDAGLGWLNGDQALRMDQTIQGIEVVRGGPSSIFYSNAPGAVVNFITRRGGDHLEGSVRYEGASYNSHRVDGWIGGPIGNSDWRFLVGGYYRLSDGQRHTGYRQDEGGQVRATISREFERGSLMLGVKRIDERIGNAMVTPFVNDSNGDPVGVPGFNAKRDIIAGKETRYFDFLTPDGVEKFDNRIGTTIKLTQLTGEFDYELTDGLRVEHKMRYRDSYTKRNSITPRTVASAADLLSSTYGRYVDTAAGQSLGFNYTNGSGAMDLANANGNGLALLNLARSFTIPEDEFVSDTRFLQDLELGGHHDLALGFYYAHVKETYRSNSAAIFTDVKDNAALLDAVLRDAAGNTLYQFTNDGIASYGSEFNNAFGKSDTIALYASDEWKLTDRLRIDGGVRWEQIKTSGQVEGKSTVNLNQSDTAADDAVLVGSGMFAPFSRKYDHMAWTLGANYQLHPRMGAFARFTSTFRLPSVSSFLGNAAASPVTQKMDFYEVGLKYASPTFDVYLTGFNSVYKSYEISDYRQNAAGQYVLNTVYGDTKTWGTELEATWRPVKWFDIHANWTWQDARFTDFVYTNSSGQVVDYSKNRLIRVPEHSFRITPGINLMDNRLRVEADFAYYGQRYAEVANQISLPAYSTIDLNAKFDVNDRLTFNLYVNNLTNTIGLTEGNPRAGSIDNEEVGDLVYIARSIFGRSVRGAVTFRF